ncbi:MAG: cysteine dioxygenase family protein [Bacteroidetes bacterium]|nr:cysteine dioxygenase family protein [Bacteroidota bacterium]
MKNLDILFDRITNELKAGKTLNSLTLILESYSGSDWKPYKFFSPNHYTRNIVRINDVLEMVVICWEINQGCPIHDHPKNGCLLKILQGEIKENTYLLSGAPVMTRSRMLPLNTTSYQEGGIIGYELFNNSDKRAASLHFYSPPNYKPNYY